MASILKDLLTFITPIPPQPLDPDYNGLEFRWKFISFRPALFTTEAFIFSGLVLYVLVALLGKTYNSRLAEKWFNAHFPLLKSQFSKPAVGGLVHDGSTDMFSFSTGRKNIATLHAVFTLRPRHDIFQMIYQFLRTCIDVHLRYTDDLYLDFKLFPGAVPNNFVWAIVSKDELPFIKKERWDLTFTRTTENPAISDSVAVMAEYADITESLFKLPAFTTLLDSLKDKSIQPFFKSLSITDQPRVRPSAPLPAEEKEIHLILVLKPPRGSKVVETLPLVSSTFNFIDSLSKLNLRPQTKTHLKKTREDLDEMMRKELEKEKEEEAGDSKKAAKRKAEEERISKLSAAEQAKHLERERKRSQRKQQGKVAIRK